MQPLNIQQTLDDISVARLSTYRSFFPNTSHQEAYGIYCWNEALSSTLFRLISITEIVMRNRFHKALSLHCSGNPAVVGMPDANDWFNHIALPHKSKDKIKKATEKHTKSRGWQPRVPPPSPNDVVSQMTFGFWPALLNSRLPWGSLLPSIVPGHRYTTPAHWAARRNQDALYTRIDLVNQLRNRIAHFEPVWKQGNILEEKRQRKNQSAPAIVIPAPTNPADAINMLHERHNRTAELLRWLSPDRADDYRRSYVHDHFLWICSLEGLDAYRTLKPGYELPLARFKRDFNSIARRGDMVRVRRSDGTMGTYYPIRR